jgi:hypothetical protein
MATDTKITNAVAIAMCDVCVDTLDASTDPGWVKIYTVGSGIPTSADEAISDQTLLATLTCSATAFQGAVDDDPGGKATAYAISNCTSADAGGVAAFFRGGHPGGGGTVVTQGTCGLADADMIMNTTTIASGATVAITSWTVTMPEG